MSEEDLLHRFEQELLGKHGCAACKKRYASRCVITEMDVTQFVIDSTKPSAPLVRPMWCPRLEE